MKFRNKVSKMSARGQLRRAAGKLAHKMARDRKDPLQTKYDKLFTQLKMIKKQLSAKYSRQAITRETSAR